MSLRAAQRIDWLKLTTSKHFSRDTLTQLSAFRKRFDEVQRQLQTLESTKTAIDFDGYRKVLSNKKVVDEVEAATKAFKPTEYDVAGRLKVVSAFEQTATEQTTTKVAEIKNSLKDLEEAIANIETARPVHQITAEDVIKANPKILEATQEAINKGDWNVPGYTEKFGNMSAV
ncbi:mitochondrial ATP synthase [Ramicandelaber brevisporus]|nr:mitochondrial ATP synthase [Ramicandelaber brevisporus]